MTQRLCKACGNWHDLEQSWPVECYRPITWKRSDLPTPQIIFDTMDAVQSQTNGKMYDSKSALRKQYKQAGVIEVGNDSSALNPKPLKRPKIDQKAVANSVDKAFARVGFGA